MVAKARDRHLLCSSGSSRCLAGYVYAAAGEGESSTDLSWDGQTMIYENGTLLAESERFPQGPRRSVADCPAVRLRNIGIAPNGLISASRVMKTFSVSMISVFGAQSAGHDAGDAARASAGA